MVESLLTPSSVKLFGRVLTQLYILRMRSASLGALEAKRVARKAATAGSTAIDVALAVNNYASSSNPSDPDASIGAWAVANATNEAAADPSNDGRDIYRVAKLIAAIYDLPYAAIGGNQFLRAQLDAPGRQLAAVYSFAFEGRFCELPKPAIFLVHGNGVAVSSVGHGRTTLDVAGVIAKEWEFSESSNPDDPPKNELRVWEYDKGDFSMRMDVETGSLEQILLMAMMRGGPALGANHHLSANHHLGIGSTDPRNRR
jgi:hypothetical protein